MKEALITGVNGQDGSYLAELLLEKGYEVTGLIRRSSSTNTSKIRGIKDKINIVEGDVTDFSFMLGLVSRMGLDEIYNLAAQSHVGNSFSNPIYTANVNYIGCLNILEVLAFIKPHRDAAQNKVPRFYQASTSEMYGSNFTTKITGPKIEEMMIDPATSFYCRKFQNEDTPFSPNSPYAIAKLAAHNAVNVYREAYGLHASCGILFNHESPRRGEHFVTRKITKYLNELMRCVNYDSHYLDDGIPVWVKLPKLKLGNLEAFRDWGYAKDYVEVMWKMLQEDKPGDYVIGTGVTHTVKDFLHEAFSLYGLKWEKFIEIDKSLIRPVEVPYLRADATLAKEKLGWTPKTTFKELVKIMVENDPSIH